MLVVPSNIINIPNKCVFSRIPNLILFGFSLFKLYFTSHQELRSKLAREEFIKNVPTLVVINKGFLILAVNEFKVN